MRAKFHCEKTSLHIKRRREIARPPRGVLIHQVSRDEAQEEERQRTVNQLRLLALCHRVRPEPVALVLLKPRDLLPERLELELLRPARRTTPVIRQVLKLRSRAHGIEIVPNFGLVFVHAALTLPVALPDDGELFHQIWVFRRYTKR